MLGVKMKTRRMREKLVGWQKKKSFFTINYEAQAQ
jgi:hypothetical protein